MRHLFCHNISVWMVLGCTDKETFESKRGTFVYGDGYEFCSFKMWLKGQISP